MESSPAWAPDEPHSVLLTERLILSGISVGCVAYGIEVLLFFLCLSALIRQRQRPSTRIHATWMLVFVVCLFILSTVGNATQLRFLELMFVDNRNFPGGPVGYATLQNSIPVNVACYASYFVSQWFADGLLLYRLLIIWNFNMWVFIVPALSWIVSIIMSTILLVQIAHPGAALWANSSVDYALAFWSTSTVSNILVTILIVGRLMYMRYQLHSVMGPQSSPYLSVSTMLTESAFLYSSFALAMVITLGINSPANLFLLALVSLLAAVACFLIIYRVSEGRGWSRQTYLDTFTKREPGDIPLRFAPNSALSANPATDFIGSTEKQANHSHTLVVSASIDEDEVKD